MDENDLDYGGRRVEIPVGDLIFDATLAGPDDGELVVLLHGFPQTSWCWRRQVPVLAAAGLKVLAPDQRGYSPRARPADVEDYRGQHLRADVLAMADQLGAERFHVVGHDWGGAVAWQLAGHHPERIDRLAVLSTPHPAAFAQAVTGSPAGEASDSAAGDADQQSRSSYMLVFRQEGSEKQFLADGCAGLRFLYETTGLPGAEADHYVQVLGDEEALRAALNWYRAVDVGEVAGMGPITAPTLYIWSTEDPALGRTAAEATAQYVEGPYRFEVLEGIGHWIADQVPDRLDPLLVDHLTG